MKYFVFWAIAGLLCHDYFTAFLLLMLASLCLEPNTLTKAPDKPADSQ